MHPKAHAWAERPSELVGLSEVDVLDIHAVALHDPISTVSWVASQVIGGRKVALCGNFDGLEDCFTRPFLGARTRINQLCCLRRQRCQGRIEL